MLFDPDIRFPQATTYKVEIPAGTKSATGNVLKKAVSVHVRDPRAACAADVAAGRPDPARRRRCSSPSIRRSIRPTCSRRSRSRPAARSSPSACSTPTEIEKDADLKSMVAAAKANEQDGRWLAFKANDQFPTDTAVTVTMKSGTPSAEGPNKTPADQQFDFRTYAPLKIVRAECGWNNNCPPGTPFQIEFNNPLDVDKFEDALVAVTPDIPGLKIQQSGNYVTVWGATKAHTTYKVQVSGGLLDDFGQTLGKDAMLSFRVGPAVPTFFGPSGMVVVDPSAKTPASTCSPPTTTGSRSSSTPSSPRTSPASPPSCATSGTARSRPSSPASACSTSSSAPPARRTSWSRPTSSSRPRSAASRSATPSPSSSPIRGPRATIRRGSTAGSRSPSSRSTPTSTTPS